MDTRHSRDSLQDACHNLQGTCTYNARLVHAAEDRRSCIHHGAQVLCAFPQSVEDAVNLQPLRPYVVHVRVADAEQVVVVSSVRHVAEERSSSLHLGEHVVVLVPSNRAHVCAERQCASG